MIDERMYQANIELVDRNKLLEEDKLILQKRINKAIEYIEEHRIGNEYSYEYDLFQRNARTSDLLKILKGEYFNER